MNILNYSPVGGNWIRGVFTQATLQRKLLCRFPMLPKITFLRSVSLLAFLASTTVSLSSASSLYWLEAYGSVDAQAGSGKENSISSSPANIYEQSYVLSPTSVASFGSTPTGLPRSTAEISLSVYPGQLHGLGYSTALAGPSGAARGDSFAVAAWFDTLTFGGPPAGTPVDVQMTFDLHSVIGLPVARSGPAGNSAEADAVFQLIDFGTRQATTLKLLNSDTAPMPADQTVTGVFQTTAGSEVRLTQNLQIDSGAFIQGPPAGSIDSLVDVSNTESAYLTVLTPGAVLESASGATYAQTSSVPEPATIALFGFALLALSLVRIKKVKPRIDLDSYHNGFERQIESADTTA